MRGALRGRCAAPKVTTYVSTEKASVLASWQVLGHISGRGALNSDDLSLANRLPSARFPNPDICARLPRHRNLVCQRRLAASQQAPRQPRPRCGRMIEISPFPLPRGGGSAALRWRERGRGAQPGRSARQRTAGCWPRWPRLLLLPAPASSPLMAISCAPPHRGACLRRLRASAARDARALSRHLSSRSQRGEQRGHCPSTSGSHSLG